MLRLRSLRVLARLAPSVISLRADRKRWLKGESTESDMERYRRNAQRALDAFIDLGPVYIKLGQWLSARADILPKPYMDTLSRLQDDVPAAPFEDVLPELERELGPVGEAFDEISREAISGASLGQVYRARLRGEDVVVKVRRPGIERAVREDLRDVKALLPAALRFINPNLGLTVKAMFAQFVETIHEEMDYGVELENLRSIRKSMAGSGVIVPDVYEDRSTRAVLTMRYVPGTKVTDIRALDAMGIDRERLVVDIHKVFFLMLLRHPVFHADPHPGNVSVAPDGRIILYDYGMVGRLDGETRLRLIRLYAALADRSAPRAVRAMDDLGMLVPDFNRHVIERAISLSIRAMHGKRASELEVNILVDLVNRTMGNFPFLLPKHLSLYMRMATLLEGIYKTHGVKFTFMAVLKEILEEEHMVEEAYMSELRSGIGRLVGSAAEALELVPEVRRFLDDSRSARARPARSGALLPGSILAASTFVGSSIIYSSGAVEAGVVGMMSAIGIFAAFAILGRR